MKGTNTSTKMLTIVGMCGAGKSTTANLLLQERAVFPESDGIDICTTAMSSATTSDGSLTVFDTPGIDIPNGQEHFEAIAAHLREFGGLVAFVHDHGGMDFHVLQPLEVLAMLLGDAFSTSCVLITTKWPHRRNQSDEDVEKAIAAYHAEVQRVVQDKCGHSFARCYAYNISSERQETAFVEAFNRDFESGCLRALAGDEVISWSAVHAVFMHRIDSEEGNFQRIADRIQEEGQRVKSAISWHQKVISPITLVGTMTGCLVVALSVKFDSKLLMWMGGALTIVSFGGFVHNHLILRTLHATDVAVEEQLSKETNLMAKVRRQRVYVWNAKAI